MVDLAVPRDIEPEVSALSDVFLYAVDDLAEIVKQGMDSRQAAAHQAENIIETRVQNFMDWLHSRETVPTIRALRDPAERQRRQELERALKQLARGDAPETVLDYLSHALTNKLMHGPTQALSSAAQDEREALEIWLRRLYHLHQE